MTIFLTFLFTAILLLTTNEWITSLLTPNNLAEIGVVILGMVALSASLQLRTLFEKAKIFSACMPNTPTLIVKKEERIFSGE